MLYKHANITYIYVYYANNNKKGSIHSQTKKPKNIYQIK